jgi:hypothetical protein
MPIDIALYSFQKLTTAINLMKPVPSFIRSLLFGQEVTFPTKAVAMDLIINGEKLAPFVKRGHAAQVIGKLGVETKSFEPPMIKMKKDFSADDLYFTRPAGFPVFVNGAADVNSARENKIAREQQDMLDRRDRTIEYMCAKALSGSFTVTNDDGSIFTIDYQMPAANIKTLEGGRKWDAQATALPLDDIQDWSLVIKDAAGKVATICIMNTNTWLKFRAAATVQKYLDKLKINLGSIQTDQVIIQAGARRVADIEGVTYYTYDGLYTDENGQQRFIPDGKVHLVAPNNNFKILFGAIEDLKAGTVEGKIFSKMWMEEDPSAIWVMVESHPLPAVCEPGSIVTATVF